MLTARALAGLEATMELAEDAARRGVLRALVFRSAKPASFVAGADLDLIAAVTDPGEAAAGARRGQALFSRIAALPVPTVAAIRGVCLGGGTELALACDHRIAADSGATRIGLPEVQLGILPAWGGTTRLPRLVGLRAALDLLLSGKPASVGKARRIGLVDAVLPATQFEGRSHAWVEALVRRGAGAGGARSGRGREGRRRGGRRRTEPRGGRPKGRGTGVTGRLVDGTAAGRALLVRLARRQVMRRTKGHYPAPLALLDLASRASRGSVEASLEREARAVGPLAVSKTCKNLLRLFQEREALRRRSAADGRVRRMAVVGAGPMGGGIAQVAAWRDIAVRLKDIRHEAVAGGLAHARAVFEGAVRRRRLRRRDAERKMVLVSGAVDYSGVGRAEVVVEAVVERLAVKRAVLAEVEAVVGPDALIATNTSSLSVTEMAAGLDRPERFAGMHFFNPVHRMPLVEVVRGEATSDATVRRLAAFAVQLGKSPIVTRDSPGFLVNRILAPFLTESGHLLEEGWDAAVIDRAWTAFGAPMGPYRLIDEVGIDVVAHAGKAMAAAFGARLAVPQALEALAGSGRLGRKGGAGFYRYGGGRARRRARRQPAFDMSVYGDIGLPKRRARPSRAVVRDRLLFLMVNEAARVLQEGVVESATEVDLGMVLGTGFPPFRGGLLRFADDLGLAYARSTLQRFRSEHGDRYRPCRLLADLADSGATFHAT